MFKNDYWFNQRKFILRKRVSLTPETAKNINGLGLKVIIESEYATHIGISDKEFESVDVEIKNSYNEVLDSCKVLIKVNLPSDNEVNIIKENTILIGMMNPTKNKKKINQIISKKVNVFSLELLPRITRAQSMDVLSSQSNLAGYRAVVDCVSEFEKAVPMMMTAAGTVPAAKVLVIGAGVAGLQSRLPKIGSNSISYRCTISFKRTSRKPWRQIFNC